MRFALNKNLTFSLAGFLFTGCIVVQPTAPPPPVTEGPVISDPGVVVIDTEPPPADRVYIYDPGYPPGVYFYDDYYWYGGYRYPHDVFINRYVDVNVRERRYIDIDANRRMGATIEARHRTEYANNHGRRGPDARSAPHGGPDHGGDHGDHR